MEWGALSNGKYFSKEYGSTRETFVLTDDLIKQLIFEGKAKEGEHI